MIRQLIGYVLVTVLALLILGDYLSGERVLLTTDSSIRSANIETTEVFRAMVPHWYDGKLLGEPRGTGTQVANWMKAFTGGVIWNNTIYGMACLTASLILLIMFRRLNHWAAILGAMTAFWLGTNFTTIYPGHNFKPFVTLFFVCSLLAAPGAATGSLAAAIMWGGCIGLMFAQQPDVALFAALFGGAYLLFHLWKAQGWRPAVWAKVILPAALVAFLFAGGPLLHGYTQSVKGATQMQSGDAESKWNYVTQWSLPPEDTVAFVAPGFVGWRTGEQEGPYWGRLGRAADWEKTGEGFQNFKLDDYYYGMIPVLFALFALFSSRRSKYRSEILFWGGALLVALLLAMGKYIPLYALFYKLPVVNAIRAPIKFLHVFQVCLAVLSIYGMHLLLAVKQGRQSTGDMQNKPDGPVRLFFWFCAGSVGVLLLTTLALYLGRTTDIQAFMAKGWPQSEAVVIVDNRVSALLHAVWMGALVAVVFGIFAFPRFVALRRFRNWLGAGLILVVAADAVAYSKHYLREMPRSYIKPNALTDFLQSNLGQQRVAFLSQEGINNVWISYLMPYNRIPCFSFSDMPRMSKDYGALLEVGAQDPVKLWRFSSVKYLLGPAQLEQQLSAAYCRKVFAYGLQATGKDEFRIVPSSQGPLALYEVGGSIPRFALFAGSRMASDEEAFSSVTDLSRVTLPEDSSLPVLDGRGMTGSVEVLSYRPGKVRLRLQTDAPAILRAADRYNKDWRAFIDGEPAALERVDFLCLGVAIPEGEHEVLLHYAPGKLFFYMQLSGLITLLVALVIRLRHRRKVDHVED